ncbi:MAG: plastocyanin/azurin family copper-binding protein [Candidatus Paceibacterota bacterium]
MSKIIIGTTLTLVLIGGIYYFISNKASSVYTPSSQTTSTVPTSDTSPADGTTVSIHNFSFTPSTLTVKTGTTVTWINNDNMPHTVTSDSGSLPASQPIAPGQSFNFTFTAPGSVSYHCSIHPVMKGAVTVTN